MSLVDAQFPDASAALGAVQALHEAGIGFDRLSLLAIDSALPPPPKPVEPSSAEQLGLPIGGLVGALAVSALVAASLVTAGVGLVAAGPLAAVLAGAGAGGVAGGVTGALVGAGLDPEDATSVERAVTGGAVYLAAHVSGDEGRAAEKIFRKHGGLAARRLDQAG